jgi:hypothetical protein
MARILKARQDKLAEAAPPAEAAVPAAEVKSV